MTLRAKIEADIAREEQHAAAQAYRRRLAAALAPAPVTPAVTFASASPLAVEMAYYDETGFYEGPEVGADISEADRRFAFSAQGQYVALCKERTGDLCDEAILEKRRRESARLLEMSEAIAAKMGEAGFNCYRDTSFELYRYYLHSREVQRLPSFRRMCFVPYVAQGLRAPILCALEYWLSRHVFARFWTFTSGLRVRLSGVRDRIGELHARLNDLNCQPFMRALGVRIVFRSTELGTPEQDTNGSAVGGGDIERDETGQLYFNVHAHCVVEMAGGYVPPEKWSRLLERVHGFWRHVWFEGGAIQKAREVCKYVTKPAEMLKLTGAELVALQEQLSGMHLVQPLGSLKAEIKARNEPGKRQRLVKRCTPDGMVYYVTKDWNQHARRTRTEKGQDAAQKLTAQTARGAVRIVARGMPAFGKCGIAEPVATVMCLHGSWDERAVRAHPLIAPIISATVHAFDAGAAIKVHTRTPTAAPIPAKRPARPRGKPKRARLGAAAMGF